MSPLKCQTAFVVVKCLWGIPGNISKQGGGSVGPLWKFSLG